MKKFGNHDALKLADHIKPGSAVTWGQGSGEALTLLEKLIEERADIGGLEAFVGLSLSGALQVKHTDFIKPYSYGALGTNQRLKQADVLSLYPCNYSAVCGHIRSGRFAVDTVFVQVSPPGPDGSHSLGYCSDFQPVSMNRASLVIAEINHNVPWTYMDAPLDEDRIDYAIETDHPIPDIPAKTPSTSETQIAANVGDLVPEGATLQYGIGALPGAIVKALSGHRNLGLHTGIISEDIIGLVQSGALNNSRKAVYPGLSIGTFCIGGKKLQQFLHCNESFQLHPASSTHSPVNLSRLDNLVAINSALEVDLFGQVNAEQIGDNYLGAIGGQVDFMHAAATSEHGLAIIALPAISSSGQSRIVAKLNGPYVTTGRSDVDIVVTEFGVADLRGRSSHQRGLLLCDIAAPEYREKLKFDFLAQGV